MPRIGKLGTLFSANQLISFPALLLTGITIIAFNCATRARMHFLDELISRFFLRETENAAKQTQIQFHPFRASPKDSKN